MTPAKTYNSGDSLVVTDPTTNPPLTGLITREQTGPDVFQWVWSYVRAFGVGIDYNIGVEPKRVCSCSSSTELEDLLTRKTGIEGVTSVKLFGQ